VRPRRGAPAVTALTAFIYNEYENEYELPRCIATRHGGFLLFSFAGGYGILILFKRADHFIQIYSNVRIIKRTKQERNASFPREGEKIRPPAS